MLIDLHGIAIACESPDPEIRARWAQSFSSRRHVNDRSADIAFELTLAAAMPARPATEPIFTQGDLLSVHQPTSQLTIIHFARFGQLHIDLQQSKVSGEIVETALNTYGVLEDVIAMGLTALLRRRHLFLIHAFAAAWDGRALLLVGGIGSGKTTTGISLLRAGWKLLSNDSPLLADGVMALAYPGLLSAYDDTLQRFPELATLVLTLAPIAGAGNPVRKKISFAAERVYPDVWIESAPVAAIVFPRVAHLAEHQVMRLSEPDALRRLLPNAIDRWDTAMIPEHFELLKTLVAQAHAYQIELGENVDRLPSLMQELIVVK
jgi:hypothetical protein